MKNFLAIFELGDGMKSYVVPGTGIGDVTRLVESYTESIGEDCGEVLVYSERDLRRLVKLLKDPSTPSDIPPEYIPGS